jgi:hypothetical protein
MTRSGGWEGIFRGVKNMGAALAVDRSGEGIVVRMR